MKGNKKIPFILLIIGMFFPYTCQFPGTPAAKKSEVHQKNLPICKLPSRWL